MRVFVCVQMDEFTPNLVGYQHIGADLWKARGQGQQNTVSLHIIYQIIAVTERQCKATLISQWCHVDVTKSQDLCA